MLNEDATEKFMIAIQEAEKVHQNTVMSDRPKCGGCTWALGLREPSVNEAKRTNQMENMTCDDKVQKILSVANGHKADHKFLLHSLEFK